MESLEYLEEQEERLTSAERRQLKKARKKNRKKNKQLMNQGGNALSEGIVSPNMLGTPEKKPNFSEEKSGTAAPNKENQQAPANQQTQAAAANTTSSNLMLEGIN